MDDATANLFQHSCSIEEGQKQLKKARSMGLSTDRVKPKSTYQSVPFPPIVKLYLEV